MYTLFAAPPGRQRDALDADPQDKKKKRQEQEQEEESSEEEGKGEGRAVRSGSACDEMRCLAPRDSPSPQASCSLQPLVLDHHNRTLALVACTNAGQRSRRQAALTLPTLLEQAAQREAARETMKAAFK